MAQGSVSKRRGTTNPKKPNAFQFRVMFRTCARFPDSLGTPPPAGYCPQRAFRAFDHGFELSLIDRAAVAVQG